MNIRVLTSKIGASIREKGAASVTRAAGRYIWRKLGPAPLDDLTDVMVQTRAECLVCGRPPHPLPMRVSASDIKPARKHIAIWKAMIP